MTAKEDKKQAMLRLKRKSPFPNTVLNCPVCHGVGKVKVANDTKKRFLKDLQKVCGWVKP